MTADTKAKSLGDVFPQAWARLSENPAPLLIPFGAIHVAEAIPELGWHFSKVWLGDKADQGQFLDQIFGALAQPSVILVAMFGFVALMLLVVAAYTAGFAWVIAFLKGSPPDYKGAVASLTWFGLVLLLPYVLFIVGAAIVLIPLIKGGNFAWANLFPMLAAFAGALVAAVLVRPLFFAFVGPAVQDGSSGLVAMQKTIDRIRRSVGEYLALALAFIVITIATLVIKRIANAFLPQAPGGDLSSVINGNLSAESLYKAIFLPAARPLWATIIDGSVEIMLESARDAYLTLVVLYWYLKKD